MYTGEKATGRTDPGGQPQPSVVPSDLRRTPILHRPVTQGQHPAHTHMPPGQGHWPCALCTHSPHWPLWGQVSDSQCGKRKFCCFTNKSIPTLARLWINTTHDYSVACPQNNDNLDIVLPGMGLLAIWRVGTEMKQTSWWPERRLSESHLLRSAGCVCLTKDTPGCNHTAVRDGKRNARN